MLAGYTGGALNGTVNVTKGNVKTTVLLGKQGTEWNFRNHLSQACRAFVKVSSAIADTNEKTNMAAQLVFRYRSYKACYRPCRNNLKLVGADLTLGNGNALDTERVITRYAPVPQVKHCKM